MVVVVVAVLSVTHLPATLAADDGSMYQRVGIGFEVVQEHLLTIVKVKRDIQVNNH